MIRNISEAFLHMQPCCSQDENQDFYAYIYSQGAKLTRIERQMQLAST